MNKRLNLLWATKTKNDEWWSSFVTAPIAIAANYLVVDYKWLTPNRLTLLSFIVAIFAAILIVIGGITNFIIATVLINMSHILDCMDGQMARYRGVSSKSGSFFDKLTDQIQVFIWFGAVSYAAYLQSQDILPIFLAFAGVSFFSLRGYTKYVVIYTEMREDKEYLKNKIKNISDMENNNMMKAGLGYGFHKNLQWFLKEQRKILSFDEGVFIFMLSISLIFNILVPMLWIFAISQIFYGFYRAIQRGYQLHRNQHPQLLPTTEK